MDMATMRLFVIFMIVSVLSLAGRSQQIEEGRSDNDSSSSCPCGNTYTYTYHLQVIQQH